MGRDAPKGLRHVMGHPAEAFQRRLEDDGFYTPEIKQHSVEKIRLHNYYVDLFTTSMKSRWPQRAYLGLYSGSGRACIEATGEIIETTALSALRTRFPFTNYIFVDSDPRCIEAFRGVPRRTGRVEAGLVLARLPLGCFGRLHFGIEAVAFGEHIGVPDPSRLEALQFRS